MTISKQVDFSVVIPIFYSAESFPVLYSRLTDSVSTISNDFEIIAVVDGCKDESANVVASIAAIDPRVKLIEFSRNFGNQAAITAGLLYSCGEYVVVMDDDLEDPPEIIPRLFNKAKEGFEVVYAVRKERKISALRHLTYKAYYRILNKLTSFDIPENTGDFCLMHRKVVDVLNLMPENNRYVRGLRAWTGFRQAGVEFDREARHSGDSGFSLSGYLKFAFDGVLSFSKMPLVYVTVMGLIISFLSFILGFSLVIAKVANFLPDAPGWASIVTIVLFIGGVQLLSIGVLGGYIGRIYDEVKMRPAFIVKHSVGLDIGDKGSDLKQQLHEAEA